MKLTRRHFLRLAASTAIAPALARAIPVDAAPLPPMLWGDGINDDAPALQALLDGNPIRYAAEGLADHVFRRDGVFHLGGLRYRIGTTLRLRNDLCVVTTGGPHLIAGKGLDGPVLRIEAPYDTPLTIVSDGVTYHRTGDPARRDGCLWSSASTAALCSTTPKS
jgi:hypothetical protein